MEVDTKWIMVFHYNGFVASLPPPPPPPMPKKRFIRNILPLIVFMLQKTLW